MFDMYRSLALLCILKTFLQGFLTANYYADFYRSLFTAEDMLMQDGYLTCLSCRMNCKLLLSYLLHYQGVLIVKVNNKNNYYKYVHYKYVVSTFSSYQYVWIVERITILTQHCISTVGYMLLL